MKLIWVHGSADTSECFYHQTRYFPESEAIDLPGHPVGAPSGSVELYVEWLRGYIDGKGYGDVTLAGHSLGGAIVLTYALKYPDRVRAVIPLGSGPYFHIDAARLDDLRRATNGEKAAYQKWLDEQIPRDGFPPAVAKHELEERIRMGPRILYHDLSCCARYNIVDRLEQIRVPTLAIAATGDPYCPPADSQKLVDNMPDARMVVVDSPGHWLMVDRAEEVNRAIKSFLEELE